MLALRKHRNRLPYNQGCVEYQRLTPFGRADHYMAMMAPPRLLASSMCFSCRQRLRVHGFRRFTISRNLSADPPTATLEDSMMASLGRAGAQNDRTRRPRRDSGPPMPPSRNSAEGEFTSILNDNYQSLLGDEHFDPSAELRPHRMHIYAHKHNTHITLVQPPRPAADTASSRLAGTKTSATEQKKVVDTLMSLSTGNIGFRKAGRGSYDAAFQLAAFVLRQMQEKGITSGIKKLEVILRGYGAGREAVTKALLGTEGRNVRTRIVSVIDATRLKQGGPRSKKPRRLG